MFDLICCMVSSMIFFIFNICMNTVCTLFFRHLNFLFNKFKYLKKRYFVLQLSDYNQSAWQYSETRQQYYYAPSGVSEPQLNFREPKVQAEFSDILTGLLKLGVNGFQLEGVPKLLVDEQLRNETLRVDHTSDHLDPKSYVHSMTENLPELGPIVKEWRTVVKAETKNGPLFLVEDLESLESYQVNGSLVIDLPRLSGVLVKQNISAAEFLKGLNVSLRLLNGTWPLWEVRISLTFILGCLF